MSILSALPGHPHNKNPGAEALQQAFDELPPESKSYVVRMFAHAWTHYEQTGDMAPLRDLTESLATTVQLRDNERLRQTLADGDAETSRRARRKGGRGVEVSEFVSRIKAKYGD